MCNFSSSPNPVVAAVSERIDMTRIENFCIILLNNWYTDLCISVFRIRKIEMQFIIIILCKHLSLCVVGIKKPEWTLSSSFAEHRNCCVYLEQHSVERIYLAKAADPACTVVTVKRTSSRTRTGLRNVAAVSGPSNRNHIALILT